MVVPCAPRSFEPYCSPASGSSAWHVRSHHARARKVAAARTTVDTASRRGALSGRATTAAGTVGVHVGPAAAKDLHHDQQRRGRQSDDAGAPGRLDEKAAGRGDQDGHRQRRHRRASSSLPSSAANSLPRTRSPLPDPRGPGTPAPGTQSLRPRRSRPAPGAGQGTHGGADQGYAGGGPPQRAGDEGGAVPAEFVEQVGQEPARPVMPGLTLTQ